MNASIKYVREADTRHRLRRPSSVDIDDPERCVLAVLYSDEVGSRPMYEFQHLTLSDRSNGHTVGTDSWLPAACALIVAVNLSMDDECRKSRRSYQARLAYNQVKPS